MAEDENNYAFLDINPVAPGHTLVIPKREVDYLFDLTDEEYVDLQLFAKRVATAIKQTMPCQRVGVAVMGLEVPHAHIHLIPINEEKDMNFFKEKATVSPDEMARIAQNIADAMGNNHSELF